MPKIVFHGLGEAPRWYSLGVAAHACHACVALTPLGYCFHYRIGAHDDGTGDLPVSGDDDVEGELLGGAGSQGHELGSMPGIDLQAEADGAGSPAGRGDDISAFMRDSSAIGESSGGGMNGVLGAEAAEAAEAALEAMQMMAGCSVIVGMHPDQAAGPIVDLALALDKPFGGCGESRGGYHCLIGIPRSMHAGPRVYQYLILPLSPSSGVRSPGAMLRLCDTVPPKEARRWPAGAQL